jgi:uncharacterized membrane protein
MRRLWNTFLKGLAAVLPVALTIYLVVWLGTTAESILGGVLRAMLPGAYWPGMGILVGFVVVLLIGVIFDAYVVQRLFRSGEALLARIPIVKTIFGALKDFTRFLPAGGNAGEPRRVVLWSFNGARLVGFVTEEHIHPALLSAQSGDAASKETGTEIFAVYFPMSYQIGGYTLYLPKTELEETTLSVEEGMRMVLIGGVTTAT